jgi:putative AdoMet-dependent methyltransferase
VPKFKKAFNLWAPAYDEEVTKASSTGQWMFGGYDRVLDTVVDYCELDKNDYHTVLDIGCGTGNLAARFLNRGLEVTGVDPSPDMRRICAGKYPGMKVMPGDFLKYPRSLSPVDLIVSTYAFHHLTEKEKAKSVPLMKKRLKPGGRLVIADFMFKNALEREQTARTIRETTGDDMPAAFEGEYPALYDGLLPLFQREGFMVDGQQLTLSVWILRASLQAPL